MFALLNRTYKIHITHTYTHTSTHAHTHTTHTHTYTHTQTHTCKVTARDGPFVCARTCRLKLLGRESKLGATVRSAGAATDGLAFGGWAQLPFCH